MVENQMLPSIQLSTPQYTGLQWIHASIVMDGVG